jgi:putative transposase
MARLPRFVFPGYPHHVVQRGNHDQSVFEAPADYLLYLEWIQEYISRYRVEVWAYCLMPNHVHVVCVPKTETALAQAFNNLHMRYAHYFNGKRSASGQLWRPRFMSCALDTLSVREEVRFIENNPVRVELAARPEDYPWSSARAHVMGLPDPILSDDCFLRTEILDWRDYLANRGDEAMLRRVRERLRTGRPAGDENFLRKLEAIAGRCLEARPKGRPRKARCSVPKE